MIRRVLIISLLAAGFAAAQDQAPVAAAAKAEVPKARLAEIELDLDGTEDPHAPSPFGKTKLNYYGFLRFVKRAAKDPELDAIILKPKTYGVGIPRLLEVRNALMTLRQSGKKVFFYKETLTTPDLVLASVADRVSMPESGTVFIPGLAIESLYMKEMLSKVRIKFDVIHIGDYKTAGESMVRDSMSKALRESLDPILDEFFNSLVDSVAEARGIKAETVREGIDRGMLTPVEAKGLGLIDRIEYYDQFREGIKRHFPGKKLIYSKAYRKTKNEIDASNPMAAFSLVMQALLGKEKPAPKGPKVAIIYCTGAIVSGKSQYDWQGNIAAMGSTTIIKAINAATKNKDVKAIVLRINSPGGSALASDVIWHAVENAKAKKPVIASMGDVAASGGYYIAMGANQIVAQPQTITGSIGVVGMVPNVDDLYKWVGITPERLTRGKRAAGFMTSKSLSDDDKNILREHMRVIYGDFVAKAASGRGKTPAELEPLARGRIWSGRDALKHGLVDKLGGLQDAVAMARDLGGIKADAKEGEDYYVLELPKRAGPLQFLEEMFGVQARLGLDLEQLPVVRKILSRIKVMQLVAKDRICIMNPELSGFMGR